LPDSFAIKKQLKCRNLKLTLENNTVNAKNAEAVFEVKSANALIRKETTTLEIEDLKDIGWYYIKMAVQDYKYCSEQVYYDSIYIPSTFFLGVQVPKDTLLCNVATFSQQAKTINGVAPFTYKWTGDDSSSQQLLTTQLTKTNSQYIIEVTDKNSCTVSDTIKVKYYNPTVTLSGTTTACAGDTISVEAQLKNTIQPIYGWVGFTQGQTKFKAIANQNSSLAFILKDSSGCNITQTHFVRVYAPKVNYGHRDVYCESDSIILSAIPIDGLAPYQLHWQPFNKKSDSIVLGHQKRGVINLSIAITDTYGCENKQYQSIRINPTPDIQHQAIAPICESSDAINLINYIKPKKGIWSGEGVSNNYFRPYSVQPSKKKLTYYYIDSLSFCSNQLETEIEVDAHPVADFSVDSLQANYIHNFQFTNTSRYGNKHQFLWNFGDPNTGNLNTSTQKDVTHLFSDSGEYTIKLVLSGGTCPPDSIIKTNYISVIKKEVKDSSTVFISELKKQNHIKVY
jgi:hypothetical protein